MLTVEEVATILRTGPPAVRRMINTGQLPAVRMRIGSRWLISREAIDVVRAMAGATQDMRAPLANTLSRRRR